MAGEGTFRHRGDVARHPGRQRKGRGGYLPAGRPEPATKLPGTGGRQERTRGTGGRADRGDPDRGHDGPARDRAAGRTGLRGRRPPFPPAAGPGGLLRRHSRPDPGRGARERCGPRRDRSGRRRRSRIRPDHPAPPNDGKSQRSTLRLTGSPPLGDPRHRPARPGHWCPRRARSSDRRGPPAGPGVPHRPPRLASKLPRPAGHRHRRARGRNRPRHVWRSER